MEQVESTSKYPSIYWEIKGVLMEHKKIWVSDKLKPHHVIHHMNLTTVDLMWYTLILATKGTLVWNIFCHWYVAPSPAHSCLHFLPLWKKGPGYVNERWLMTIALRIDIIGLIFYAALASEHLKIQEKVFLVWGYTRTGTGCKGWLWSLHPWQWLERTGQCSSICPSCPHLDHGVWIRWSSISVMLSFYKNMFKVIPEVWDVLSGIQQLL